MGVAPPQAAVEVEGAVRAFGARRAVDGVDLALPRGELMAVVGPSGSGKTTLLRVVAGFEPLDSGRVRVGGREVAGPGVWVEPEGRHIGMVFQQGALFPHLDVARNVGFGATTPARAAECLELVGLADRARAFPHELSGGERQRIALARALATDPQVVLLDEPFSALEAGLRERLREEVAGILRQAGASALLVTHDQAEALSLADAVAVLRAGRIEQVGTPEEVYQRPRSHWVATFLGDADVIAAVARDGLAECELGRFPVARALEGPVELVLRPEAVALGPVDEGVEAVVVRRAYYGRNQLVEVRLVTGSSLRSRYTGPGHWEAGDLVGVRVEGPVTALAADQPADAVAR